MRHFIHQDKISVIITALIILLLLLSNLLFPQAELKELSGVNINFGNGFYIEQIYTQNSLLYILSYRGKNMPAAIYNIKNPAKPVELGRIEKNEYRGDPVYRNHLSYQHNLSGYIIQDPANKPDGILMKSHCALYKDSLIYEVRGYESKVVIYSVADSGISQIKAISLNNQISEITNISITGNVLCAALRGKGLLMLNLSDPLNPVEKILLENRNVIGHVTGNNMLLVGVDFKYLYCYDITDPWNPLLLKNPQYRHTEFFGRYCNKNFFLSGHANEICVFDSSITEVNTIATSSNPYDLALEAGFLYAGTNLGIEVYRVADIKNISLTTKYGANFARAYRFTKDNNLIYVANLGDGLKIIDVSDSSNPVIRGSIDTDGYTRAVVVRNGYAYMADYLKGLLVADVRNPDNPQLVASVQIYSGAVDLDIIEGKLFLLNDDNELQVFDVSDPLNPFPEFRKQLFVASEKHNGDYKIVKAVKDNIWIKIQDEDLTIYNYKDTTLTKLANSGYEYANYPQEIKQAGKYAFVVSLDGVRILDIDTYEIYKDYFGSSLASSPGSVALDTLSSILYVIQIYFNGFDIVAYDFRDPGNPLYTGVYWRHSSDEPLAERIIFDKGLLFALNYEGVKILAGYIPTEVGGTANTFNYALAQNYPNPFNPSTLIRYSIPEAAMVQLRVYDILGREVAVLVNKEESAGEHEVKFNAKELSGGVYLYKLTAGGYTSTRKMLLLK